MYEHTSIVTLYEPWNNYKLKDGTKLRMKTVLNQFFVRKNEKELTIDSKEKFHFVHSIISMPRPSSENFIHPVESNIEYNQEDLEEIFDVSQIKTEGEKFASVYYVGGGLYLMASEKLLFVARTKYCDEMRIPIYIVKADAVSEFVTTQKVNE